MIYFVETKKILGVYRTQIALLATYLAHTSDNCTLRYFSDIRFSGYCKSVMHHLTICWSVISALFCFEMQLIDTLIYNTCYSGPAPLLFMNENYIDVYTFYVNTGNDHTYILINLLLSCNTNTTFRFFRIT